MSMQHSECCTPHTQMRVRMHRQMPQILARINNNCSFHASHNKQNASQPCIYIYHTLLCTQVHLDMHCTCATCTRNHVCCMHAHCTHFAHPSCARNIFIVKASSRRRRPIHIMNRKVRCCQASNGVFYRTKRYNNNRQSVANPDRVVGINLTHRTPLT